MAKKATLTTLTSTNNTVATLNANFTALNDAFDNTVSRDGSTPNTLTADLDANSQELINIQAVRTSLLYIGGVLTNSIGNLANWAGDWATSTSYDAYDIVFYDDGTVQALYRCLVDHTSGTFATDLAAGNWEVYVGGDHVIDQNNVKITGGSVAGITDLAVADGGTAASNAGDARTNLGLAIGTDVQAYDAILQDLSGLTLSTGDVLYYNGTNLVNLGVGTNGQVLTLSGGVPTWASGGGGGGASYTKLLTQDLAATPLTTTGVDITGIDAYDEIIIQIHEARTTLSSNNFYLRFSNDGGTTFYNTNEYTRQFTDSGSDGINKDVAQIFIGLGDTSGGEIMVECTIKMHNRSDMRTRAVGQYANGTSSTAFAGVVEAKEVHDAMRILMSTNETNLGELNVIGVTY